MIVLLKWAHRKIITRVAFIWTLPIHCWGGGDSDQLNITEKVIETNPAQRKGIFLWTVT